MGDINNLYEQIDGEIGRKLKYNQDYIKIPEYITNNLKHDLYDWQKKALQYFLYFDNVENHLKESYPVHLMFNMATGSGKTLIMASTLLYYYKQGYRHFIFLVNQSNIVDKTQNNFIDETHTKYLFKDKIVIDDRVVDIKEVDIFSDNPKNIEMKFTTIQKLHNDIHIEKENNVTLNELNKKDLVILADEAHHLNADTKRNYEQQEILETELLTNAGKDEIEKKGWEHTVINLILNKNKEDTRENKNVLLEFTATMDENKKVVEKYKDKIIFKFTLKEFLGAGYTKEINLISSRFNKKERILQALLFNWYRSQVALKYFKLGNDSLINFKPVILFRSKTIAESREDYSKFQNIIKNLNASDFQFIQDLEGKIDEGDNIHEQGKSKTLGVLKFIKDENIYYSQIVEYIKGNFAEKNCIITNSEDNTAKTIEKTTEEQERLLNSLEDKNNNIRAIFTVKRLTEGWDVLNLFDIVRLYEGQNEGGSNNKASKTTIQEKQLIGRGVRYYPFEYKNEIKNKRKFDEDMGHELRILEELNYYTYDERSRYITSLKNELRKDGYINDNKKEKIFKIKDKFKDTTFYKDKKVWKNRRDKNPNRRKSNLEDIDKNFYEGYTIKTIGLKENIFRFDKTEDIEIEILYEQSQAIDPIPKFKDFDKNIIYKAINIKASRDNSLYQFKNLKKELNIESIDDLMEDNFLGDFDIPIYGSDYSSFDEVQNSEKLNCILEFLDQFENQLKTIIHPYVGSKFNRALSLGDIFDEPKKKVVEIDEESENMEKSLANKEWYVLDSFNGTDQERELVNFIEGTIKNLKDKYEEVYLLRNEEKYTIYDFNKGRGFQPDFIMFLKEKGKDEYYQLFIEPKGDFLMGTDDWKDIFLREISERYGEDGIDDILEYENDVYRLIGLPLYNSENSSEFKEEYEKIWSKK